MASSHTANAVVEWRNALGRHDNRQLAGIRKHIVYRHRPISSTKGSDAEAAHAELVWDLRTITGQLCPRLIPFVHPGSEGDEAARRRGAPEDRTCVATLLFSRWTAGIGRRWMSLRRVHNRYWRLIRVAIRRAPAICAAWSRGSTPTGSIALRCSLLAPVGLPAYKQS